MSARQAASLLLLPIFFAGCPGSSKSSYTGGTLVTPAGATVTGAGATVVVPPNAFPWTASVKIVPALSIAGSHYTPAGDAVELDSVDINTAGPVTLTLPATIPPGMVVYVLEQVGTTGELILITPVPTVSPNALVSGGVASGTISNVTVQTSSFGIFQPVIATLPDVSQSTVQPDAATAQAGSIPADGVHRGTVVVTVRDGFGTPMVGQTVQVSVTGTGNTIADSATDPGPSQPLPTNMAGQTSCTIASTQAETKTVSATVVEASGTTLSITQTATLTFSTPVVNVAPAFTSASGATFTVGSPGTFTFTATGYPTPISFKLVGGVRPAGVGFDVFTGTLSGTPAPGTGGTHTLLVQATNGVSPAAMQNFTLTVDEAPAITSSNYAKFNAGVGGAFTVTASGFPGATFSESGALPNGVTFNTATGVLSGTPTAGTGGSYPITFTASNGVGANATQSFTLDVFEAPKFTNAAQATFAAGSAGTFAFTATGYPTQVSFKVIGGALPSGVGLGVTGVLSGTPAPGTGGTYPVTIQASNGASTGTRQNFTLTVDEAPAITSFNYVKFNAGTAGTFTVTASGFPGATFSESGALPNGVTFNTATGVLSGTPVAGTGASYPITFTASNGIGANATQSFTLDVFEAPTFTNAAQATFTVGSPGTFNFTATGYPTQVSFKVIGGALPSGVGLGVTGVLSGTPAPGTGGTYSVTIQASNGASTGTRQNFSLTVDEAPAITSVNSVKFNVGSAGTFTVRASGFPGATFSESGALPNGVTFNTATGVLRGTPVAGTGGSYPITFTASNGVGANATQSFTLDVFEAPKFTNAAQATFTVGSPGTFNFTATGYPTQVSFKVIGGALPSGVGLGVTGVLSGTPAPGTGGAHTLTIQASNGASTGTRQNFTLTVDEAPAITSGASANFTVGSAGSFAVTASGYPASTFTESGALPGGVTLDPSTGILSGTPGAGTIGTYPITLTASNGANATQSFTLNVFWAPPPTGLTATPVPYNAINLTWNAQPGATGYNVYRNGVLVGSVPTTTVNHYLDAGLAASTAYTYAITSLNGSAETAQSPTVTATTLGPGPVILSVSPSLGPKAGGTTVTITGVNVGTATAVQFGGIPAASFTRRGRRSRSARLPAWRTTSSGRRARACRIAPSSSRPRRTTTRRTGSRSPRATTRRSPPARCSGARSSSRSRTRPATPSRASTSRGPSRPARGASPTRPRSPTRTASPRRLSPRRRPRTRSSSRPPRRTSSAPRSSSPPRPRARCRLSPRASSSPRASPRSASPGRATPSSSASPCTTRRASCRRSTTSSR